MADADRDAPNPNPDAPSRGAKAKGKVRRGGVPPTVERAVVKPPEKRG